MGTTRAVRGAIRLPACLLVTPDVCGESFEVTVEATKVMMTVPKLADGDHPRLLPVTDVDPTIVESVGLPDLDGFVAGSDGGPTRAVDVRVVEVEILGLDDTLTGPYVASRFGGAFDDWWGTATRWLELWVPQHLSPDSAPTQSRGKVLDLASKQRSITGWSGAMEVRLYSSGSAITRPMLRTAFVNASDGLQPPLEWVLFTRATRLRDRRQALINASTAAEVTLAGKVHALLEGTPETAREQVVRKAGGVVGLVDLVEKLEDSVRGSQRSRIASLVAGPRNDAVHRGEVPSTATLAGAVDQVRRLLETYSPLPGFDRS